MAFCFAESRPFNKQGLLGDRQAIHKNNERPFLEFSAKVKAEKKIFW